MAGNPSYQLLCGASYFCPGQIPLYPKSKICFIFSISSTAKADEMYVTPLRELQKTTSTLGSRLSLSVLPWTYGRGYGVRYVLTYGEIDNELVAAHLLSCSSLSTRLVKASPHFTLGFTSIEKILNNFNILPFSSRLESIFLDQRDTITTQYLRSTRDSITESTEEIPRIDDEMSYQDHGYGDTDGDRDIGKLGASSDGPELDGIGRMSTKTAREATLKAQQAKNGRLRPQRNKNGASLESRKKSILGNLRSFEKTLTEWRTSRDNDQFTQDKIGKVEMNIVNQMKILHKLENRGALDEENHLGSQVGPLGDHEMDEDEQELADDDESRKRNFTETGFKDDEDFGAFRETVVIDDTPKKIKREKKDKKDMKHHKKRKTEHASQDSSRLMDDIPLFGEHGPIIFTSAPEDFDDTSKSDRLRAKVAMQDEAMLLTPEQNKQSALLETITRGRSRSDSNSGDRIYKALLACIGDPPSPMSPCSPEYTVDHTQQALIGIGRAALEAPILPKLQKPIRDPAFVAQAPVSKTVTPMLPRESPILPPERNFSLLTKAAPAAKASRFEKLKTKKKDPEGRKAQKEEKDSAQVAAKIQDIESSSQIIRTTNTPILPPTKPSENKVLSSSNDIKFSTPVTKSVKPKKAKSRKRKANETQNDDWETDPGRLRARITKENEDEDVEAEENVAFSSAYIGARPGISISGTKFDVLHVVSGTAREFPISVGSEAIKICSVAKGRVTVSLGTREFTVGENGMWRVRSGEKCSMFNSDGDGPACVHVTAVES
ncbi:uncharacterized protein RAG0_16501 [Rhynchosporium agropyri]|uniref:Uncharacterized protein n=1 Tax=Rhynchosporium agropyri TaxID=914238 RepID=A0A1E1LQN8_9HELO|nr:uncharacterized protein RAG0_16501 [Rhynchosporium agropyri]